MLLRGHTIEETLMARDTVIFLLQQLGFVLNLKKSVLTPIQRIEFLAVTIDSLITKSLILKSPEAVPRTSSENISVDFRINKTNRLIVFNYSNSSSSTSLEESELRPNRKKFPCHTKLAAQIWYPLLLEMSIVCPLLLPRNTSLKNPQGEVHPLIASRTLRLAVWTISGKDYLRREFQKQLPNLLQVQDKKV